jgi:hypothetical protein
MLTRFAVPAVLSLALAAASGSAQAGPYTGTGGGPETTVNAPYRSSVGQTVPPGRATAPTHDPEQRTDRQRQLDSVLDSICRSC